VMARSGEGLRDFLRRPLPLPYHPLFRFYEGGALTRSFRGLPARPDDWWSEDWVGSCTCAGNADPDGRVRIVRCLGPVGSVGSGGQPGGSDDQPVGASGQPGASGGQEVAG
jgi:hypothetical protein